MVGLAKIILEQHTGDHWHGEVEIGGMVARRAVVSATTFKTAWIATEAAYLDMLPKQPEAADAPQEMVHARDQERKVTTMVDDRPIDVTPVPDRALPTQHQQASLAKEQGQSQPRDLINQPLSKPVGEDQRPQPQETLPSEHHSPPRQPERQSERQPERHAAHQERQPERTQQRDQPQHHHQHRPHQGPHNRNR